MSYWIQGIGLCVAVVKWFEYHAYARRIRQVEVAVAEYQAVVEHEHANIQEKISFVDREPFLEDIHWRFGGTNEFAIPGMVLFGIVIFFLVGTTAAIVFAVISIWIWAFIEKKRWQDIKAVLKKYPSKLSLTNRN